jgi:hypothetical protein
MPAESPKQLEGSTVGGNPWDQPSPNLADFGPTIVTRGGPYSTPEVARSAAVSNLELSIPEKKKSELQPSIASTEGSLAVKSDKGDDCDEHSIKTGGDETSTASTAD